jgi:hypothetical protein
MSRVFLFSFLIIIFTSCITHVKMSDKKYSLVSKDFFRKYAEENNWKIVKQIPYNQALVFAFSNGKFGIHPMAGNYDVICPNSIECDKIISSKHIDIERETDDPYETLKTQMINLEFHEQAFYDTLSSLINIDLSINNEYTLKLISDFLNNEINTNKHINEKLSILINLYMLSKLKIKINGKYELDTVYTFNTYYYPLVSDNLNNKFSFQGSIQDQIYSKHVDLVYIFRLALAESLGIPLFSKEHQVLLNNTDYNDY